MKKNKLFLVTLIISMLILAACGILPSTGTTNVTSTGASNGSQAANNPTPATLTGVLDPALGTGASTKSVIGHVYECLTTVDMSGQLSSVLASTVTVSEDGLDYIFVLRPGVNFHDGTELNADAVVSNFNRWFDPKDTLHGSGKYDKWASSFGGFKGETTSDGKHKSEVDGIQKQDTMTVIVHLNKPDANFLKKLADPAFSIVSPAALAAAGFGTQSGVDGGSGPYKLGTWTSTSLALDPFSGYWDSTLVPASSLQVNIGQ